MAFKRQYTLDELSELQGDLAEFAKKLEQASEKILDDMATMGIDEMEKTYMSLPYTPSSPIHFTRDKKKNYRRISMVGSQAVYNEFGTGTWGERMPHPQKSEFALDPYNYHVKPNGTIRPATAQDQKVSGIPVGELFWTYKDEDGDIHYTQGVPAGKEGYNASQKIRKNWKRIARKRIGEITK